MPPLSPITIKNQLTFAEILNYCLVFCLHREENLGGNSPGKAKITVYHVYPEAQVSCLCEQGELHTPSFNHSGNCSQLALTFIS